MITFPGLDAPLKLYAKLLVCACVHKCWGAFMYVYVLAILF